MGCYSLDASNSVTVAVLLSLLGYAIGNILRFMPGLSRSTRASAASMVDYSIACLMFAAFAGGMTGLLDGVITAFVPQGAYDCAAVGEFFSNSVWKAVGLLTGLGAVAAALPFIPVVGAAISIAFTIAMAPAMVILGAIIIPLSTVNYVMVKAFEIAGPFMFTAGVAAIAVPNRLLKGLGAVLISFAIVFYTALPLIPYAIVSILGWSSPREFLGSLEEYAGQIESLKNQPAAGWADYLNPANFYKVIIDWAMGCILSVVLVAIAFAAARGLSQSVGGVSAGV